MKVRTFVLCLVVTALCLPVMAKSPIKPGKWQLTIESEMPGMPVKMPPIKVTNCITKEQAENPESTVPADKKSSCKVANYKLDGNTITWTIDCPKEQMKGKGSMTYDGDSYTGSMDATVGEMSIKQKYTGKYLGECDEK